MEILSLTGIFVGLLLMILLTYKGHSIIWVAPLCSLVAALFAIGAGLGDGRSLLSIYTVDYMTGVGEYFISWFPVFFLGAIYGTIMNTTGAAKALADLIVRKIGYRFVVLAVLIPCMILTYGGVSLFVVVFIMYPMGCAIYREANIPRELLPSAIAFGSFGITMTCIPGTPQIQNLIPMEYFGTTATAAPWLGLTASLLVGIPGYLYLDYKVRKARKEGLGFLEQDNQKNTTDIRTPAWMWIGGLVPLIIVFVTLNVLKWNVVVSLSVGIVACCLFGWKQIRTLPSALTEGAKSSVTAIMNSASAVGFGSVIRIVPGFALLTGLLFGSGTSSLSLILSETMSTCVLSGATGSASGGLSIALATFSDRYLEMAGSLGISPDLLHRFAAIAAGSLDKLPHNGAVITLLAVSGCTHKESYKDIFVVSVVIPMIALGILVIIWGLFVL